ILRRLLPGRGRLRRWATGIGCIGLAAGYLALAPSYTADPSLGLLLLAAALQGVAAAALAEYLIGLVCND
ncbi:MAG: hypothetical protein K6B40_06055, partial [Firmicutes bacterium]|nr:hypothetical protein [Bacillota bacterium]